MEQTVITIDQLNPASSVTEDTNFLVTQSLNDGSDYRQEFCIKYTHLSDQIYNETYNALYKELNGQMNKFLENQDCVEEIKNKIYDNLFKSFLSKLQNNLTVIGTNEVLTPTSTIENIINAINNSITEFNNNLNNRIDTKIDTSDVYTKADINTLYKKLLTVEDYLSSTNLDQNIIDIEQEGNDKYKIILVDQNFSTNNQTEDQPNSDISTFNLKPEIKVITLQSIIDYIKTKIDGITNMQIQDNQNKTTIINTYNSEKLMHFRDNEQAFSTTLTGLSTALTSDNSFNYVTSSYYTVANEEEELLISFTVPVTEELTGITNNSYAAIQIQINQIDANTNEKKWINIVKKSLRQGTNTTCSLQAHIIADKSMVIRGFVYTQNKIANESENYTIKYSVLTIDTLVENDNYIGTDPVPTNYTSYIYANDFNRSDSTLELSNFNEELKRVKIFGPTTWKSVFINQDITSLESLASDLCCSYNLKISYSGAASIKNTAATVRCALLNINNDYDKNLLSSIIEYKYNNNQANITEPIYKQLKWFNLGYNYVYANTSNIGEVLLGQYYFPNDVYVILDIGLDNATTQNTCLKIEYKHGPYTKHISNKEENKVPSEETPVTNEENQVLSEETPVQNEDNTQQTEEISQEFFAGQGYIDITTIQNSIFNDDSLTTRISYELSTERCPELSAVRKFSSDFSYAYKLLSGTVAQNKTLISNYSYIRINEQADPNNISAGVYIPNNVGLYLINNTTRPKVTFTNKENPGGYFGLSCNDLRITKPLSSINGILYGQAERFTTQYVKDVVYQLSIEDCIDTLQINTNHDTKYNDTLYFESIRFNKGLTSLGDFCLGGCNMISSIDFGNAQVAKIPTCFAHISYMKQLSNYPQHANILLNKNVTNFTNIITYDKSDLMKADLQRIIIPSQLTSTGDTNFCSKIPQVSDKAITENSWLSNITSEIDVILPEKFDTFDSDVEDYFQTFITALGKSNKQLQLSDFNASEDDFIKLLGEQYNTKSIIDSRDDYLSSLTKFNIPDVVALSLKDLKSTSIIYNNTNLYNLALNSNKNNCISVNLVRAFDRSYTGLVALYHKANKTIYVNVNTINTSIFDFIQ